MNLSYAGITSARKRLARLAEGLREAASGEVVARAVAKIGQQIVAVAEKKTTQHRDTGAARGSVELATTGGLVQLSTVGYLKFHAWWPYRRGMPPFVVKRAALIFARELVNVLGVAADQTEAAELVSEADDAEIEKVEKRARAMARPRRRR
jgi:hypothetical protein